MLRLRDAVSGDLAALHALDQRCFPPGIAYSLREIRLCFESPACVLIVAESDSEAGTALAGFAIAERMARRGRPIGHIITIDVDEASRRSGVGRALMQAVEDRLRGFGLDAVWLEVAVDNPAAQTFYAGLGYETTGRIPRYYLGRTDALVMQKQL